MTARIAAILALAISFAVTACVHVEEVEPRVGPPPSLSSVDQNTLERVVRDFAQTKKWLPDEYSIKLVGGYGGIVVYTLAHRDDTTVGGGKSVELHIDRATKRVVRELGYQ